MKKLNLAFFSFLICFFCQLGLACGNEHIRLQVLGSGGPELNDKRASTSYLIWINNKASILVDTGSGSSLNFEKAGGKITDLQAILYTHFHVDHSADIPAYIKGSFFTDRKDDLLIFGPAGNDFMPSASEFINNILGNDGAYKYLNNYLDSNKTSEYKIKVTDIPLIKKTIYQFKLTDTILISAVQVHHGPLSAIAWRIDSNDCSITFSGDMSNRYQTLVKLAKNTDLLVAHNAIPEEAKGIARKLHMSPSEIGKIAKQANVKKLLLSHRMLRTLGNEDNTSLKIKENYAGPILFADDMDVFEP